MRCLRFAQLQRDSVEFRTPHIAQLRKHDMLGVGGVPWGLPRISVFSDVIPNYSIRQLPCASVGFRPHMLLRHDM